MSTAAIDTTRTTERLNFFMSKILDAEPVDQFFESRPLLRYFWKNKKVDSYGRQGRVLLSTGQSPNFRWHSAGDTFDTNVPDVVRNAVFALQNAGDAVVVQWEEMMEASTSDVRAYDIVKHRKDNSMQTIEHQLNLTLAASGNPNDRVTGLPNMVDATSTVGGINRSTAGNEYWQAQVRASVGAFTTNGLTEMRTGYNLAVIETGDTNGPDFGITTRAVHESFESELDADVRYADPSDLSRGAKQLHWKGFPVHFDTRIATGEMYFLNKDLCYLAVEKAANMTFRPFKEPTNGLDSVGIFVLRLAHVTKNPRGLVKLTGIT